MVLLDCLLRAARQLRVRVSALHVNHGLSPNAKRWEAFCRRLCRARGVPLACVKVRVAHGAREGVEAAARAARYAAFRAARADYVVLAHHQDDQAETLLLQLLRGAGLKGLAAMPLVRREEGAAAKGQQGAGGSTRAAPPRILRPLLEVTRGEILDYAKRRGLKWIEDESNADVRYARNFLRHRVLPLLAQRFPACRSALARSAHHLAEAAALLDEMAAADGAPHLEDGTLAVEALRRLPPARARNLLRYFLASHALAMPGVERLNEALRQVLTARRDARVAVDLGAAVLRRYAGRLYVVRCGTVPLDYERKWRGEREIALPELGGMLRLQRARGEGISLARLRGRSVVIRVRRGGERLQPDCRRPRRPLKKLLQEACIPPWERDRLPLLCCDGNVVIWAAGAGVDCAFQAAPGQPGLRPVWQRLE